MGKKGQMEAVAASLKIEIGEWGYLLWGLLKVHEWHYMTNYLANFNRMNKFTAFEDTN